MLCIFVYVPHFIMYRVFEKEWCRHWFQFILDHPEKDWDYSNMGCNLTWGIVSEYADKGISMVWWMHDDPNVTWNLVRKCSEWPWDYTELSRNSNITWDIIQANPDKPWNYNEMSRNPSITWDIIQANPDKPWLYRYMSSNPSITWATVQANLDKPWSYHNMSENPSITWDIVQANPDISWDYMRLSGNPNITWDIVQANPDKPWNYGWLGCNLMSVAKDAFIRKRMQEAFTRSALKEELCQRMFHPRNMGKWAGWGLDFDFVEEGEDEGESND